LGYDFSVGFLCNIVKDTVIKEMMFPEYYNLKLLRIQETLSNIRNHGECVFENGTNCTFNNKLTVIVPINGNRQRLGTLVLARFDAEFTDDDLVLAEYSATVIDWKY